MTFQIDEDVACFNCDTCSECIECAGCGRNFTVALIFAKERGWKSYMGPDKEWAHACPVCVADWTEEQRRKRQ